MEENQVSYISEKELVKLLETMPDNMVLSVKLDAPDLCRLDAPELVFACCASADCLHQHLQVI